MEVNSYIDQFTTLAWQYAPKILSALLILVIGFWVIRKFSQGFNAFLRARKIDESLSPFFGTLVDISMKIVLLLVVASTVGIQTTSFIAIFSAVAFAVGFALQGSLGNFASGILVLLFRPYKVGDHLVVADKSGRVTEIQIFNTVLTTQQGKKIIIPNSKMTEGAIENIAEELEVQAEISLLVNSDTPLDILRAAAATMSKNCPYTIKTREGSVQVNGISRDDMKVNIACWTLGEHYEETIAWMFEAAKEEFEVRGIELAKERRKDMAG
ncbi:MAG: mechanosensitive ion channel [Saprospiraceae bacterium]|nr:mechanosensitive ion channel [Saprospiraceae bacterium]